MTIEEYAAYRETPQWAAKRAACMERYGHRCQVCGTTYWRRPVDAHHLHYRNVGNEHPDDLVPLCTKHHTLIHNQPDGYDMPVLRRLKRECEEDFWDDPLPARFRARYGNPQAAGGFWCRSCESVVHSPGDQFSCPFCDAGLGGGPGTNPLFAKPDDDLNRVPSSWGRASDFLPPIPHHG